MSPDTNNNIEHEDDDETSEEEDDDEEEEPVFKFSTITASSGLRKATENVKDLTLDFSCIAVHEKFLVIGKATGEILITDHAGHSIPQYQIKAHTYPVNAISIDENGEFIGSCCQEGKVNISGLFSKNSDQLVSFPRPVRAVCLDPNFAKNKRFVTGDTALILNEKSLMRQKKNVLWDLKGGLIHTIRWKDSLIAVANDKGVGVYDLDTKRPVGFEETDASVEQPRGVYPSRISWNDRTTLSVACAKTIKIVKIVTENTLEHQATATTPKKHMSTVISFKIEFYACGLTTVNRDLVVLGIEEYSDTEGTADLSLTVLSPKDKSYEEKAHNTFHMFGEKQTLPFQFQLEYLPGEQSYFILSPFDIVKAERRDYDDHIDYLIGKNQFEEAIAAFEKPPSAKDKPLRHTHQSVYRAYVKYLIEQNDTKTAVKLFSRVYTTAAEWEEQILNFTQRNQLDIIAPHIPISPLQLKSQTYERVLLTYLHQKKYDKLKDLLLAWPSMIYDVNVIDQQIRLQSNGEQTIQTLLECLAILAEKQGNVIRTLDIYLQMGNKQVFELIERKNLQGDILSKLDVLMAIDQKLTLNILINHMDKLPVRSVYNVLQKTPPYLHAYLDAVFTKNPSDCREFHTQQVGLYAEYEPEKLLRFLRRADNYNLQEALSICEKKQLYREYVFLLGRAGNGRLALQILLVELKDIEEAIRFCRETGDQTLWATLIEQSAERPEFIRGLLNHAGSDVNLQQLIEKIRSDLRIPGLRDSLCKIMQDYNIQMSLSECCRKIIVHDCLALRRRTVNLLQSGYPIKDTDSCAKCHNPLYSPDALTNAPVSVFFCLHVFHAKCADANPDVCSVCSTASMSTIA